MQISMKCSIAIHCLIFIYEAEGKIKVTSNLLSQSSGCNPVIIRNIISSLKKAGIIGVTRGVGGATLSLPPSEINLYQIYTSVEPEGFSSLIGVHSCQDRKCIIAKNIYTILQKPYKNIEEAIKESMKKITLQSLIDDFHIVVEKEKI